MNDLHTTDSRLHLVEIEKRHDVANAWTVEFVDDDGGVEQAIFAGPLAEQRARRYAKRQYR